MLLKAIVLLLLRRCISYACSTPAQYRDLLRCRCCSCVPCCITPFQVKAVAASLLKEMRRLLVGCSSQTVPQSCLLPMLGLRLHHSPSHPCRFEGALKRYSCSSAGSSNIHRHWHAVYTGSGHRGSYRMVASVFCCGNRAWAVQNNYGRETSRVEHVELPHQSIRAFCSIVFYEWLIKCSTQTLGFVLLFALFDTHILSSSARFAWQWYNRYEQYLQHIFESRIIASYINDIFILD